MLSSQQRLSTGQWVFLAVLMVVVASIGLTIYNNELASQRQADAIEAEKTRSDEQASQERLLNSSKYGCLDAAQKTYKDSWEAEVKYLGRTDGRLPEASSSIIEQRLKDAKDDCYRQYGQ